MLPNQQPPSDPTAQTPDIRSYVAELQRTGAFDQLSTADLEALLSQLKGESVKAMQMPNAQGLSYQSDDGRQVMGNPDRTAKTSQQEALSIADILSQMRGK